MSLIKFIIFFAGMLLLVATGFLALDHAYSILVPQFWLIFGFLAGITFLAYFISFMGIKQGGELSVYIILLAMVMKMIIALLFVVFYLRIHKVDSTLFGLEFFSIYFLFTVFEVIALLLNLRPPK